MADALDDDQRPGEPAPDATSASVLTAGAILRAARERQGVHIAMLAAAIKVSPRKLDALEGDRYEELPDATFTRALAQTVCRALKIDAQPVLAKLPPSGAAPLEQVSTGLNTPFRDRPVRVDHGGGIPSRTLVIAGVALLVAAAVVVLWPAEGLRWGRDSAATVASSAAVPSSGVGLPNAASAAAPAASVILQPDSARVASPAASAAASTTAVETVYSAPLSDATQATPRGATLVTSEPSWVEIVDASGQRLMSRVVQPGETVNVDGEAPMKLKIGNARATRLSFRGQSIELDGFTRENIARVELK